MITGKNQIQTGFIIADRIQHAYNTSKGESTFTINATLLDVLGKENYVKFCRKLHEIEPKNITPEDSTAYFSEKFIENPGWHKNTLLDSHVRYYWGLSTIMNTACSIL